MLLVKRAKWYGGIIRISWPSRIPSIYAQCPKEKMRIYYSLWSQKSTILPLWMGVFGCRTPGPWPYFVLTTRMFLVARNDQTDETVYYNLHMLPPIWGGIPKAPLCPTVAMALWISCMLTSQALRPHWSQINCIELPMSLWSKTTSWSMC